MEEFVLLFLIAFAAGTIKGLTGFGSSLVAIPLLSILYPDGSLFMISTILITGNVVLNFILTFENNAFSISSLKNVYFITISGAVFTFLGLYLLKNMDKVTVNYIAASLILFAIIIKVYQIFTTSPLKMKEYKIVQIISGAISGLGNGFGSIDGPPVVFYLTMIGASKKQFKNTMVTHTLVMGIIGVVILMFSNAYNIDVLIKILDFTIGASLGVLIGMFFSKRIHDDFFQIIVLIVLIILDIKMFFF